MDEAPPNKGYQVQKADRVQARVPPLDLLRQEYSLLALEQQALRSEACVKFSETLSNLCDMVDLPQAVVEEEDKLCVVWAQAARVERLLHGKPDGRHGMAPPDQLSGTIVNTLLCPIFLNFLTLHTRKGVNLYEVQRCTQGQHYSKPIWFDCAYLATVWRTVAWLIGSGEWKNRKLAPSQTLTIEVITRANEYFFIILILSFS